MQRKRLAPFLNVIDAPNFKVLQCNGSAEFDTLSIFSHLPLIYISGGAFSTCMTFPNPQFPTPSTCMTFLEAPLPLCPCTITVSDWVSTLSLEPQLGPSLCPRHGQMISWFVHLP